MSDQIDPEDLYKAAYRETQGQPVDADPRRPIVTAQQDGGLVDRLHTLAVYMDRSQHEKWCKSKTVPVHGYSSEGVLLREAVTALAEKDARIAELEAQWSHFQKLASEHRNELESQLTASHAECEGLRAALSEAQKTMRNCQGAIESDQVEDKDVRRQLIRGRSAIDAALSQKETGDE